MQRTAIVDVDGTLAPLDKYLYREISKLNPACPPPEQWVEWSTPEKYVDKSTFYRIIDSVHETQYLIEPFEGAQQLLSYLHINGFKVVIASHRKTSMYGPLFLFMKNNRLPYDSIHLSYNKTVLFEPREVKYLIDDAPHTLQTAAEQGIYSLGLMTPYNRKLFGKHHSIFLCDTLTGVLETIQQIEGE
jgi:hypothetical protein